MKKTVIYRVSFKLDKKCADHIDFKHEDEFCVTTWKEVESIIKDQLCCDDVVNRISIMIEKIQADD